jgi:hypothetical protein
MLRHADQSKCRLKSLTHRADERQLDGPHTGDDERCRWTIGADHDDNDGGSDESLNVWDAANIWSSNGLDEDYTFVYREDELSRAAGFD